VTKSDITGASSFTIEPQFQLTKLTAFHFKSKRLHKHCSITCSMFLNTTEAYFISYKSYFDERRS